MSGRNFRQLLEAEWAQGKFLCVGLDPDFEKIPEAARKDGTRETIVNFNRAIIDATQDIVGAYKPNSAFYEAHGDEGWKALRETIQYINDSAPDVPVILDAKRGDIGNTNEGYVESAFDHLHADAITVHPYMGGESLKEFFAREEKGIFVMCKNSNSGSGEFQDIDVSGEPLYIRVARAFTEKWNTNGNCGLVVGATYPADIKHVREIAPDIPLLLPGIGAQGGDLEASVKNGKDARGQGFIMSTSRVVMYASSGEDFAEAARSKAQELYDAITKSL
jgi:orotidine-5'-phosphate decarboxylase